MIDSLARGSVLVDVLRVGPSFVFFCSPLSYSNLRSDSQWSIYLYLGQIVVLITDSLVRVLTGSGLSSFFVFICVM